MQNKVYEPLLCMAVAELPKYLEKVQKNRGLERKTMGKQISYWLGYEDFLKIAQAALECGCIIIKKVSGKLEIRLQKLDFLLEMIKTKPSPAAGCL